MIIQFFFFEEFSLTDSAPFEGGKTFYSPLLLRGISWLNGFETRLVRVHARFLVNTWDLRNTRVERKEKKRKKERGKKRFSPPGMTRWFPRDKWARINTREGVGGPGEYRENGQRANHPENGSGNVCDGHPPQNTIIPVTSSL